MFSYNPFIGTDRPIVSATHEKFGALATEARTVLCCQAFLLVPVLGVTFLLRGSGIKSSSRDLLLFDLFMVCNGNVYRFDLTSPGRPLDFGRERTHSTGRPAGERAHGS